MSRRKAGFGSSYGFAQGHHTWFANCGTSRVRLRNFGETAGSSLLAGTT